MAQVNVKCFGVIRMDSKIASAAVSAARVADIYDRINDLIDGIRTKGRINFEGINVYDRGVDVITLRRQMGMVFQKPAAFNTTVYENIASPLRVAGAARDQRVLVVCSAQP